MTEQREHPTAHCFHEAGGLWMCSCGEHWGERPTEDGRWECPMCGFTFNADHTNFDGGLSCPLCELAEMQAALNAPPQQARELLAEAQLWIESHPAGATEPYATQIRTLLKRIKEFNLSTPEPDTSAVKAALLENGNYVQGDAMDKAQWHLFGCGWPDVPCIERCQRARAALATLAPGGGDGVNWFKRWTIRIVDWAADVGDKITPSKRRKP